MSGRSKKIKHCFGRVTPLVFGVYFLFIAMQLKAQSYDVLNYNYNGTPAYGVKIKTNLPFADYSQMVTLRIEGFNYGSAKPIGLSLVWYIYGGNFYNSGVSSWGGYTPDIYLSNENGLVTIFINDRSYYQRFKVSAYAQGMSEIPSWFQGWTTTDEPLGGSNQILVPYSNALRGDVTMPNGLWDRNGNVGIGTTNPVNRFQIGNNPGPGWIGNDVVISNENGALAIHNNTSETYIWGMKSIAIRPNNGILSIMAHSNGNVGIGTANPTEKLSVNGNIKAQKLIVTQNGWADYVFDSSYQLRPLSLVEQFIKEHKHLPEVPTNNEVEKNGIDVGETQALLLKKVEELTLYIIEQNKQMTELKKENERKIETLTKKVEALLQNHNQ
jgi:hypothetical protein